MNFFQKEPPTAYKHKLYKSSKVLGQGSFGKVKLAKAIETNTDVAIKSILKTNSKNKESEIALLFKEINILKRIQHPNVIKLLDWFETKDKYYLVFELINGGELFERISLRKKFNEKDAAKIIYSLLDAISFLHSHGIIHRDLKPENILMRDQSDDSDIVIADFGVSSFIEKNQILTTLTGTPAYASPEHPFFNAVDLQDMYNAITRGKGIEFEEKYWKNISKDAKDFILACTQKDPSLRPSAQMAKCQAWLIRFNPVARENAIKLRAHLIEKRAQKAKKLLDNSCREVGEIPFVPPRNGADNPTFDIELNEFTQPLSIQSLNPNLNNQNHPTTTNEIPDTNETPAIEEEGHPILASFETSLPDNESEKQELERNTFDLPEAPMLELHDLMVNWKISNDDGFDAKEVLKRGIRNVLWMNKFQKVSEF